MHSGLLLETRNESELAGVLAHEVAHVTQRHIARGLAGAVAHEPVSTAAVLAAILIGAAGGGGSDATMGAITAAQGMAAQAGINFTRENEYEADRIGIGVLARRGFRPERDARLLRDDVPPHAARAGPRAGTPADPPGHQQRASPSPRTAPPQYPAGQLTDSLGYALMKERVRVLLRRARGNDPRDYYTALAANDADLSLAQLYGRGACRPATAASRRRRSPRFERLRAAVPGSHAVPHGARPGAAGRRRRRRRRSTRSKRARELAPRNVPVTVRYGEALLQAGRPKRAHEVLLDLFNNVPPTQEQIRLTAMAANAAGDVADAYSYMAEYHLMGGDLPLAINQLELALSVPDITDRAALEVRGAAEGDARVAAEGTKSSRRRPKTTSAGAHQAERARSSRARMPRARHRPRSADRHWKVLE